MQPVTTAVTDWSEAILTSLAAAMMMFFSAIPKVIGFAVILIVGWFVASLVDKGVSALLRAVRFNDLAQRSGFSGFVQKMGIRQDASGFLGELAKWFVRLIVLVVAFDALGLPAVSDVLRTLLLWLPNLVVAMVVLVIGGLLAGAAGRLLRGATAEAGFEKPDLFARIASVTVWAFAIVVAVNQLGIATALINTLFMAVVGAAALALGLSFGLGGRDVAAELWRKAYDRSADVAPKLEAAADAAQHRMQSQGRSPTAGEARGEPVAPAAPLSGRSGSVGTVPSPGVSNAPVRAPASGAPGRIGDEGRPGLQQPAGPMQPAPAMRPAQGGERPIQRPGPSDRPRGG